MHCESSPTLSAVPSMLNDSAWCAACEGGRTQTTDAARVQEIALAKTCPDEHSLLALMNPRPKRAGPWLEQGATGGSQGTHMQAHPHVFRKTNLACDSRTTKDHEAKRKSYNSKRIRFPPREVNVPVSACWMAGSCPSLGS